MLCANIELISYKVKRWCYPFTGVCLGASDDPRSQSFGHTGSTWQLDPHPPDVLSRPTGITHALLCLFIWSHRQHMALRPSPSSDVLSRQTMVTHALLCLVIQSHRWRMALEPLQMCCPDRQ